MKAAIDENERRREKQMAHNAKHNIIPQTIQKNITSLLEEFQGPKEGGGKKNISPLKGKALEKHMKALEKKMLKAAEDLDFEVAAKLRDELHTLQKEALK